MVWVKMVTFIKLGSFSKA